MDIMGTAEFIRLVIPFCDRKSQYSTALTCKGLSIVLGSAFWKETATVSKRTGVGIGSSQLSAHIQRLGEMVVRMDKHRPEVFAYLLEALSRIECFCLDESAYCTADDYARILSNHRISDTAMMVIAKFHSMGNTDTSEKMYSEWCHLLPEVTPLQGKVSPMSYSSIVKGKTEPVSASEDEFDDDLFSEEALGGSDQHMERIMDLMKTKEWCEDNGYILVRCDDWIPSIICACTITKPVVSRGRYVLEVACGKCTKNCPVCMHAMTYDVEGKCYKCYLG